MKVWKADFKKKENWKYWLALPILTLLIYTYLSTCLIGQFWPGWPKLAWLAETDLILQYWHDWPLLAFHFYWPALARVHGFLKILFSKFKPFYLVTDFYRIIFFSVIYRKSELADIFDEIVMWITIAIYATARQHVISTSFCVLFFSYFNSFLKPIYKNQSWI